MKRKATIDALLTGLGLATAAGVVLSIAPRDAKADSDDGMPEAITLTGTVRDFRERSEHNGHPDFERRPDSGFGHYMNNVDMFLGEDGKPEFTGEGRKVRHQWIDGEGRPIHPSLFNSTMGDQPGSWGSQDSGAIQSAESFYSWFRDVPGVNASAPLEITLQRDGDLYVFDDREDEQYDNLGGFFPINGELFGNSDGENKNFHFTFELQTEFNYEADSGQIFRFIGDDDVWVFIDGRLVIDLGGVHSAVTQTVDLDRLEWLEDGETYELAFFFAERHRTQSNFRIETTLNLRDAELPTSVGMAD